ncbi:hypothetical protein AYI68_g7364 [Smittium mucronatum]|uniref:Uncharacterized protein n=1 Tax=Smittium mucronatum TaxID=133383 RepID=A0A1R0GNW9_9FUNG|nr:hypothetical protein AYI68_g7364 [Smittium mucronatum]
MDSSSASDLLSSVLAPILVNDQDGLAGPKSISISVENFGTSVPVEGIVCEVLVGFGVNVSQDTSKKGGGSEHSQEMIELMFEEEREGHRALRVLNSSQVAAQKWAQEFPEFSKKKPKKSNKTWGGANGKQDKFPFKGHSGGSKGKCWDSNRMVSRTITLPDHITGSEEIYTYLQAYINDQHKFVQNRAIFQATIVPSTRSVNKQISLPTSLQEKETELAKGSQAGKSVDLRAELHLISGVRFNCKLFTFEELKLKISAAYSFKGFRASGSIKISIATIKGLAVLPEDKLLRELEALGFHIDQIFKAGYIGDVLKLIIDKRYKKSLEFNLKLFPDVFVSFD